MAFTCNKYTKHKFKTPVSGILNKSKVVTTTPGILIDNLISKFYFTILIFFFLSQCLTLLHPLLNTIGGFSIFFYYANNDVCQERKNIIIIQYITLNPVFHFSHYTYTTTRNNHSTPYNNNTFYSRDTFASMLHKNIYNHTQYFLYFFV